MLLEIPFTQFNWKDYSIIVKMITCNTSKLKKFFELVE